MPPHTFFFFSLYLFFYEYLLWLSLPFFFKKKTHTHTNTNAHVIFISLSLYLPLCYAPPIICIVTHTLSFLFFLYLIIYNRFFLKIKKHFLCIQMILFFKKKCGYSILTQQLQSHLTL